MVLGMLEKGKKGVVVSINGGVGAREHLLQLGVVPGVPVKVLQGGRFSPLILEVLGTRIMLGHGIADKVIVR